MKTRILFLDFDGVLHPAAFEPGTPQEHFCWLPHLERLLEPHIDVRVIVHSTWRYDHRDDELSALLGRLAPRFSGTTPRGPRDQAIGYVLQANKHRELEYLVLDDDGKSFVGSGLKLLELDPNWGISELSAQTALRTWLAETS